MSTLTANRQVSQGRDVIVYSWTAAPSFARYRLTLTQTQGAAPIALLDQGWPGAGYGNPPSYSVLTPTYREQRLSQDLAYFVYFTGSFDAHSLPVILDTPCVMLVEFFDNTGALIDSASSAVGS